MKKIYLLLVLSLCAFLAPAQFVLNPQVDSIPLRDGAKLAADIHLPDTSNAFPVILIQTPYNRLIARLGLPLGIGLGIANSPYAFVIVDWRGFFGSAGAFSLTASRGEDGFDVVEWINQQPWCNGKIGGWGPSALGNIQFQTAREAPPALDCIVPLVASPNQTFQDYAPGGVIREEYVDQLDNLGFGIGSVVYANPIYNLLWQTVEFANYYPAQIEVPTMMIGGWYDHNIRPSIEWFGDMQALSPANVRNQHRMVIGPWAHGGTGTAVVGSATQGQLSFPQAAGWSDSLALRFFDFHLRGLNNGQDNDPKVRQFRIGQNAWYNSSTVFGPFWNRTYYLNSQQRLTSSSTGITADSLNTFVYDPKDPSPTIGGPTLTDSLAQGPYDQAPQVESRNDILVYTSTPLSNSLDLVGAPMVELYVSSDRPDTDFMVRLCDVYPDGRSMLIGTGAHRLRFHQSYSLYFDTLAPDTTVRLQIQLPPMSYTFLAGHRIRLDITSSNYPQYALNLNNGDSMYVAGDTLIATNKVHWSVNFPSRIVLPDQPPVSVEEELFADGGLLQGFPNPAHGAFHLRWLEAPLNAVQLQAYDVQGRIFQRRNIAGEALRNGVVIDCQDWPGGIYFLEVESGKQKKVVKMVVQH